MTRPTKYPVYFRVRSALDPGQFVDVAPDEHLPIDASKLTKEMERQPGRFAYYAALAEEEYRRGKQLKFKLHCLTEDLDEQYRKERKTRTTERELSNQIKRHPKMRKLYAKYVATMRRAGHLKVLKDAFEQRYHMLQSIGANERKGKELESEMRTLQKTTRAKLSNHKR